MRKTVRLTENDITRIVKRVMNEGVYIPNDFTNSEGEVITIGCMASNSSIIGYNNKRFPMTPDQFNTFCGQNGTVGQKL